MDPPPRRRPTAPAWLWTITTYFAEGYPYSIVVNLANLYFVAQKASLEAVGLTSLFHLPWNLKAFVGPFLDAYGTKRRWLVGIELLLSAALVAFSFVAALKDVLALASAMFLLVAVLSATHDIAIDGLYLEAIDKKNQEKLVGLRAPAWRVAMLVVTGPMAIICDKAGWAAGFVIMAAIMIALFVFHLFFLPRTETEKQPLLVLARRMVNPRFLLGACAFAVVVAGVRTVVNGAAWWALGVMFRRAAPVIAPRLQRLGPSDWIGLLLIVVLAVLLAMLPRIKKRIEGSSSDYARSFVAFLAQPHAGRILAYVILFRVGESFLQTMRYAFVKTQLGLSQSEYGVAQGTLGTVAALAAPLAGGMLIARYGLKRCIWPFLFAMNGLHLAFCAAAVWSPEIRAATAPVMPGVDVRLTIATVVIIIENLGAGLGTAVFLVYLIRCCLPEHKAAHMALLTSLMSLSFTVAGVFSGFLADWLGYALYFGLTFVVTVPGMVLTLWVPHIDEAGAPPQFGA